MMRVPSICSDNSAISVIRVCVSYVIATSTCNAVYVIPRDTAANECLVSSGSCTGAALRALFGNGILEIILSNTCGMHCAI